MSEKECGDCTILWDEDEEYDEDEYSPYASPKEARLKEKRLEQEHQKRLAHYKKTGEWNE